MRMMINVEVVVDSPETANRIESSLLAQAETMLEERFFPDVRRAYASRDRKHEAFRNEILGV